MIEVVCKALGDWKLDGTLPDYETLRMVISERDSLDEASRELTRLIDACHEAEHHRSPVSSSRR